MLATLMACITYADPARYFDVQPLAKDVYAVVRKEPPGLAVDSNVLLIVNQEDVVMVDANIGPESATATLAALARITSKPVSTIIATHYHDDHMGGVATVRAKFPNVKLIAHKSTPKAIQDLLKPARQEMIKSAPAMADQLRDMLGKGVGFTGKPISEEERAALTNDIRIADRYAKEMPGIPLPSADILVDSSMTLHRPGRDIEIKFLGEGHTPADLVVWLPKEKIAAVGDLVVYPVPLVGGPQSNVAAWPATLKAIEKLGFKTLLPGHGPVMHDHKFLVDLEDLFSQIATDSQVAKAKGISLEEAQKALRFTDLKQKFCEESIIRKVLFENYVRQPGITSAYRLAK